MLSDNELGLLEHICYMNPELIRQATDQIMDSYTYVSMIEKQINNTVGQLLENLGFTDQNLDYLAICGDEEIDGACASGEEWASILRYLKNSTKALSPLIISDIMENEDGSRILAYCFTEPEKSNEAIVAFRGTSGEDEWIDNLEGISVADTLSQTEALNFIEGLPYDKLTVIGHSKGGNKAMYVAITSSKVVRCIAYDAQGFSQNFLDKYREEIQERGKNIIHYSLSTDYVHALMFQIPTAKQVYVKPNKRVDNLKQHHSPNSFFVTDIVGNLKLDIDGKPQIIITEETETIQKLHEVSTSLLSNVRDIDTDMLVEGLLRFLKNS